MIRYPVLFAGLLLTLTLYGHGESVFTALQDRSQGTVIRCGWNGERCAGKSGVLRYPVLIGYKPGHRRDDASL